MANPRPRDTTAATALRPPPGRLVPRAHRGDTDGVASWGSYSFAFGPVLAFLAVGVLALLLRWAFSSGHSVVERRPRQGTEGEYGLLVPVAAPGTYIEGEMVRRKLVDAGVRATLAPTSEGPRVMVFPEDASVARALLREH